MAVDAAVLTLRDSTLEVLIATPATGPFAGGAALPGGRVQAGEPLDAAAARELAEHSGLTDLHLEQLYTFGSPGRDPRGHVVSVTYLGLTAPTMLTLPSGKYTALDWYPVSGLPTLAYDHRAVVEIAAGRLRAKLRYTNLAYGLLPDAFTLGELQAVYETVLERSLDRRNFRKKILSLGWLRPLASKRRGAHRPATLYEFRERQPREIDVL